MLQPSTLLNSFDSTDSLDVNYVQCTPHNTVTVTGYEKRDHLGFFMKIVFLV